MRLTRAKVMDIASDLSATRNMELAKVAEGESGAIQMTPVFMMAVRHVATTRDICLKLGLTDDITEIEVSKEQFIEAQSESLSDTCKDPNMSFNMTLEAMLFGNMLTRELFDKGENNETEKADS